MRPAPAPRLERFPATPGTASPKRGENTVEVMSEIGFSEKEIEAYLEDGTIFDCHESVRPSKL